MISSQYEKDILDIPQHYNKLEVVTQNGEKFLSGEIEIKDEEGKIWETYSVLIKGSRQYPNMFPILFETGNAFPKIADWHVNIDESCCIDVPESEIIICKNGLHAKEFIERYCIPYLANQKYRELEGYYLYGEYSHGIFGKIEFYQSKLKARSPLQMVQMFDFILKGQILNRTAQCPFCHKMKFRNCHKDAFEELSIIKPYIYFDGKEQLIPFFKQNPNYILPSS
ncbi:hypothetical protein K8352_03285 [Flavobacteriaceae bacterium F89]|uniref:Uncharacterized protein n=1 Tax=Cerina litoralis TaxID=2874477 RepID=A0AAE3ESN5_9FLAO|nr:hypothetical protein [Cerina litoralis]MCG2459760.1 hypothetical protein [Cerina litoralis]